MELLAKGGTSEVFSYGNDRILKLYYGNNMSDAADREFMNSKIIYNFGFPTPAPITRIEIDGRSGIIFQQLTGPTLMETLFKNQEDTIHTLAEMMAAFHKIPVGNYLHHYLTDDISWYINNAVLIDDNERIWLKGLATSIPCGNTFIHGDFNPFNILMHHDVPMLIDFVSLSIGNALFDVAYTVMMFRYAEPPDKDLTILKRLIPMRSILEQLFIDEYMRILPFDLAALEPWLIMAAIERLNPYNNFDLSAKRVYAAFIHDKFQWPDNETSEKMCYKAGFRKIFEIEESYAMYTEV